MHQQISRILTKAGLQPTAFEARQIEAAPDTRISVAGVADAITAFAPTCGWLLDSGSSEPRVWDTQGSLELSGLVFPLCGEFYREGRQGVESASLHIQHEGPGCWRINMLTDKPAPEACLYETVLLSHKNGLTLRYRVCHTRQQINKHQELRPAAFRFAGFDSTGG